MNTLLFLLPRYSNHPGPPELAQRLSRRWAGLGPLAVAGQHGGLERELGYRFRHTSEEALRSYLENRS